VITVGIDPGGTTGIALARVTRSSRALLHVEQTTDVEHVGRLLLKWDSDPDLSGMFVAIEDFLGAGPRNASSNHTLKVVGFTYHLCQMEGINVALVPPQARMSSLGEARTLVAQGGVHATDAAAHALALARRRWEQE